MTRYQWTVFFAAWLGWGFDVFDGLLFNFVAPVAVPQLLGLAANDPATPARVASVTGIVTSALLVGWATGGILFGWVADRVGRARTLQLTMLTLRGRHRRLRAGARSVDARGAPLRRRASASAASGPRARRWSPRWCPPSRRVAAGALLYTSAPVGILLAALVTDVLTKRVGVLAAQPDLAWRLVFVTGVFPAAFAAWIRRRVDEPEEWRRERGAASAAGGAVRARAPARDVRRARHVPGDAGDVVGDERVPPVRGRPPAGPDASAAAVARLRDLATLLFTSGDFSGRSRPSRSRGSDAGRCSRIYLAGAARRLWVTFGLDWAPGTRILLLFLDGLTVFGVVGGFSFYLPELFPTRLRGHGERLLLQHGSLPGSGRSVRRRPGARDGGHADGRDPLGRAGSARRALPGPGHRRDGAARARSLTAGACGRVTPCGRSV